MYRLLSVVRPAAFALLVLAFVGCGDDTGSTDPPTPPTANSMSPVGGTSLQGFTDGELTVEVQIGGSDGLPFQGQSVQWTVASGDGSVGSASSVSDASGRASAAWTLGPSAGSNTLIASAGTLGTVTFSATTTFLTLEPQVDITLSGDIQVERIVIPQGVTVSVTGETTITSIGAVAISGRLVGDCQELEVIGGDDIIVLGSIDNSCVSQPAQVGPPLSLTGNGPLTLSGMIQSSGTVLVRNTPDISIEQIKAGLAGSPSPSVGLETRAIDACTFDGAHFLAPPGAPGDPGTGQDGVEGVSWYGACSGDALFTGDGVAEAAGPGGVGGQAPVDAGSSGAPAGQGSRGGAGGIGGGHYFFSPGSVTFNEWTFRLPQGGEGREHVVTASDPGQSAIGTGGAGGQGGPLVLAAGVEFRVIGAGLDVNAGAGGPGGDATARGGPGRAATETEPVEPGGDATATGGAGGHTSEIRLGAPGGVSGGAFVRIQGALAAAGGDARSEGGMGGAGGSEHPDGGAGGDMTAFGGPGGLVFDALFESTDGAPAVALAAESVGFGGAGGWAYLSGGMGGPGFDFCSETFAEGGNGGAGADGAGAPGLGGAGGTAQAGRDGELVIAALTGVGGRGGAGSPTAGAGGQAGSDETQPGFDRTQAAPSFAAGENGTRCNRVPELTEVSTATGRDTPVVITVPYSDPDGDLPKLIGGPGFESGVIGSLSEGEGSVVAGSWTATASNIGFTFLPAPGFSGVATFTVAVFDQLDGLSNAANITVSMANAAPVFNEGNGDFAVVVQRSGHVTFQVPFADPDGDQMVFSHVVTPSNGSVTQDLPTSASGPTVTYSHGGNFDTDEFSVEADDVVTGLAAMGASVLKTVGTIRITVVDNAAPICVPVPEMVILRDQTTTFTVAVTDPDSDPNLFTFEFLGGAQGPQHGGAIFLPGTGLGRQVKYTPGAGFYGTDGLTVRITDPAGHVVECSATIVVRSDDAVFFTTGSSVGSDGVLYLDPPTKGVESGPGVPNATGMALTDDGFVLAVLSTGTVTRFNAATRLLDTSWGFSGSVIVGDGVRDVARKPDGTVLVTSTTIGRVFRYSDSGTFQGSVEVGPGLSEIEVAPDGSKVLVARRAADSSEDQIMILDGTTLATTATLDVPMLVDLTLSPDGSEAWISNQAAGGIQISVFTFSSMSVTRTFQLSGASGGGLSFSPDGSKLFVVEPGTGLGRVHVLDPSTGGALEASIDLPVAIDLVEVLETRDGLLRIFLGNDGLKVLDLQTLEYLMVGPIPLPVGAGVVEARLIAN